MCGDVRVGDSVWWFRVGDEWVDDCDMDGVGDKIVVVGGVCGVEWEGGVCGYEEVFEWGGEDDVVRVGVYDGE